MKKRFFCTMLAIALTMSTIACSTKEQSKQAVSTDTIQKPVFTRETYPKVDGSTATIPLSEAFASSLIGLSPDEAKKFIHHNTTHNAYVNLIQNNTDIIFVTEPSTAELAMAKEKHLELEVVPIVKEAFVFLVNTNNPIKSLTANQIQDIYQGVIKNWKEVGGNDEQIIAYQREPNSGSQTIMENTVMKGLKMKDAPKDVVEGMEGLIEKIANYDNSERAIGYSVYYYAKTMYNKDTIKFIAVNDTAPDSRSISSGEYPFTSAYYAVLKKSDPETAPSRRLLKWILGKDGQQVAEKSGYIPLEVK